MRSNFWRYGEQSLLASAVGIGVQHVNDLLHRRKRASARVARKLEEGCKKLWGTEIPWHEWVSSDTTTHPAFYGKAREGTGHEG
jgi:hypothetical protein